MTRLTLIASALLGLTATAPAAIAGNAGAGLPQCYNHVINACNESSAHPEACAEAGMNACDEYHGLNVPVEDMKIKIIGVGNKKYRVEILPPEGDDYVKLPSQSVPSGKPGRDRDDRNIYEASDKDDTPSRPKRETETQSSDRNPPARGSDDDEGRTVALR